MEEILHWRGHIWQYTMTCTRHPLFNVVFWSFVRRCRISAIQLLCFGDIFCLPMLNGEHEGLDFKCFWWCRIFSINRISGKLWYVNMNSKQPSNSSRDQQDLFSDPTIPSRHAMRLLSSLFLWRRPWMNHIVIELVLRGGCSTAMSKISSCVDSLIHWWWTRYLVHANFSGESKVCLFQPLMEVICQYVHVLYFIQQILCIFIWWRGENGCSFSLAIYMLNLLWMCTR